MVGGGRYTVYVLYICTVVVVNHHLKSLSTPPKFFTRPIFYPSTAFFTVNNHMDNRAYEQYKATQPAASMPQRMPAEPLPDLTSVEITVVIIFAIAVVYALVRLFWRGK